MTTSEYQKFIETFAAFMIREGINCLTPSSNEPYFSNRACECCKSLPGMRYTASGYSPKNEASEYEICSDCLYFAQYGQLDDMTMLDMVDDSTADICVCSDKGCPCGGKCKAVATVRLARIDMTPNEFDLSMCDACASDAMESGVFTTSDDGYDDGEDWNDMPHA